MKPSVIGFIFARGGSKGVPRKNVRLLAGKPLIAYAIETALASRWTQRTIVSTDDSEIAEVARRYGAEVPFVRPAELAGDDSPEWLAWQHAIRTIQAAAGHLMDVFVSVPPTSPIRSRDDVDDCVQVLMNSDADAVITVKRADRNPYFNMVTIDEAGYASIVVSSKDKIHRRQSAPAVYDITTVAYAARPEFILSANSLFEGKIRTVVVPAERALDIDTELDFEFAEFLLNRSSRKGGLNTAEMASHG